MNIVELLDSEFIVIQKLLFEECGISLNDSKKSMVVSRLFKRVEHYQLSSYADYLKIVQLSKKEKTEFLNALSTNETYFFRESCHFEFLEDLCQKTNSLKVWSAAASMGAEAYSIAFLLDTHLPKTNWCVYGSDLNTDVLKIASKGLYPLSWSEKIPEIYRSKYCYKGSNDYENKMLIDRNLRKNMIFFRHNLMEEINEVEKFDVIFLRNVLLYFNENTKVEVIKKLMPHLKNNGYFIISLTETFEDKVIKELKFLKNNIYQKVEL